jgi:cholesterol transport system auxiliary component
MRPTLSLPKLSWPHIFAAGCVILALTACAGVGGKTAQLYVLNPSTNVAADTPSVNWQLAIAIPVAPANLDTTRIALNQSAIKTDYFASAEWTDRTPVVVQNQLVKAFDASGKLKNVFRDSGALRADYVLDAEIRDFEAQYAQPNAAPNAVVRIESKLIKVANNEIVGSFIAEKSVQASQNQIDSIVGAFNEALGAVLQQTVEWSLRTGPASPVKRVHHRHRAKLQAAPEAQPATPQH